jgi:cytochrome c peroxidase
MRPEPVWRTLISGAFLAVAACGGGGGGVASGTGGGPVVVLTAPGAPTIGAATPGNASAGVAFSPPASDGGAAITSYTATCTAGATSRTASAAASPITVSNLTNGTAFACSVTATNSVGTGPASAAVSVTPNGPLATPTSVSTATTLDFANLANYASPQLPAYYDGSLAARDNTPAGTTIDNRVAMLGRVLFYDRRLSINDTTACASCHQQAVGFGDPRQFSLGFAGTAFTSAHSMRLGNVRYFQPGSMFWDKRTASLELQAVEPVQNAVEMGWTAANGGLPAVFAKMTTLPYYPDLFNFAFGTPEINQTRFMQALAQFQRAMISSSSRWDQGYATTFNVNAPNRGLNADLPNLTAQENRGRQIYFTNPGNGGGGCNACHEAPTFALDNNSRSNGLDAGETRLFKSPSLKSIGIGGPYMHDGRFTTLDQVVDHYNSGVQAGPALDNRLRGGNGQALRLNLSVTDRAALVAFLRTLDDPQLTTDARFSTPFRP